MAKDTRHARVLVEAKKDAEKAYDEKGFQDLISQHHQKINRIEAAMLAAINHFGETGDKMAKDTRHARTLIEAKKDAEKAYDEKGFQGLISLHHQAINRVEAAMLAAINHFEEIGDKERVVVFKAYLAQYQSIHAFLTSEVMRMDGMDPIVMAGER